MKEHQRAYEASVIILIIVCSMIFLSMAISEAGEIEDRAIQYYQPESWPKSTRPPIPGLNLEHFTIPGFELIEKRTFAPTMGTGYIWNNEVEQLELWIVVNVYDSVKDAHNGMFSWMVSGTTIPLKRGMLTNQKELGDISWADPAFPSLVFARDNVVVLIMGHSKKASHAVLIENIASLIDNRIRVEETGAASETASKTFQLIKPVIKSIALDKLEVQVNQTVKLTVVADDPSGEVLRYAYYATGGNILETKEGVFYQALTPGRHEVVVTVINESNIRSEAAISITVY